MRASGPDTGPRRVEIILHDGFVLSELAGVIDPLRIANRLDGRQHYVWQLAGARGEHLSSADGIPLSARRLSLRDPLPDILVLPGSVRLGDVDSGLRARISAVQRAGGLALLLSDAVSRMMQAGAIERAAVHWEAQAVMAEMARPHVCENSLYLQTRRLVTSAGMASTYDAMLEIVADTASASLADEVARVLLLERRRSGSTEQPSGLSRIDPLQPGPLRAALRLMEQHTDTRLSSEALAKAAGLSTRQLERLFRQRLRTSPQRYHRLLRLRRARQLVEGSGLSLLEISLACGFESQTNLARAFLAAYGTTPHKLRRQGIPSPSRPAEAGADHARRASA